MTTPMRAILITIIMITAAMKQSTPTLMQSTATITQAMTILVMTIITTITTTMIASIPSASKSMVTSTLKRCASAAAAQLLPASPLLFVDPVVD